MEVGKIDGHQKRLAAKVVRFPFYDPESQAAIVGTATRHRAVISDGTSRPT